jgi:DNA-binding transcriptional MerR regulator
MKDVNVKANDGVIGSILSQQQLAKYFGVTENTIIKWGKIGLINPIKILHKVYYRVDDIQTMIKQMEGGAK